MSGKTAFFNFNWDVDKYKTNYDSEHWPLCKSFMLTHKSKFPEEKLVHLTEAFYQIGVYGSSYDPKTTRMVSALAIEVLDEFLELHPGSVKHPFKKSVVVAQDVADDKSNDKTPKINADKTKPASIWDVAVDQNIIANILVQSHMKSLLKGFVIIYDVTRESYMNDNKVSTLEESFKRSKFGPCYWDKIETHNTLCPIRMRLKWKGTILAEGEGSYDSALRKRLAQAVLSKLSAFSHGIEAKWSYYRDGRKPDQFDRINSRKTLSSIYTGDIFKGVPRSQFKAMEEVTSYIDTFANSDSFAEIVFGMDFSNRERKQIIEYIQKTWGTKLTYRTVSKMGVKSKSDTHLCVYHLRTGEELKRWLEKFGGENERYRLVPPGEHRRAGRCDNNVKEVLTAETDDASKDTILIEDDVSDERRKEESDIKEESANENNKEISAKREQKDEIKSIVESGDKKEEQKIEKDKEESGSSLEKLLDGFVLFYNAKRNSEIDKDDWFSALCESFKISKFGPLEVITDNVRALRTRCILKWNGKTLASAEGLTETQAKTAATLQLISKLEPFTYIIQAKDEYFFGGKLPPFLENPDPNKSDVYRVVRRKDLPSYYSIFQTIDDFTKKYSDGELVFGADFTWELKNEIVVYLKAKGLDYRYFTVNDQKPWSHMAIFHSIKPDILKEHLLKRGGENEKYKLIPPQRAETISKMKVEVEESKVPEKPATKPLAQKRKQPPREPTPPLEETEANKIQINLKTFKKDKVEYPEDTGGDFPGLILWIGIRKNSMWQKNLFVILIESFKLSKYGELVVEETEENVWGRREPLKKCVIKANRKVLGVGLGESKAEAKNCASLQVLRELRRHCYTIQAKQSYFKEGKATPYDFNPDPAKEHVYSLVRRNVFKDRAAIIQYIDEFSKKNGDEEVIFGDDFTYDEREVIISHCRQIRLGFRLMKCQIGKGLHTHVAIFLQKPPPVIKAALMETNGENDKYRLIPPGGKITQQINQIDLWPDTLESDKIEKSTSGNKDQSSTNKLSSSHLTASSVIESTKVLGSNNSKVSSLNASTNIANNNVDNESSGKRIPVLSGRNSESTSENLTESFTHKFPTNKNQRPKHNQPMPFQAPMGPHLQPVDYNVGAEPFHFEVAMGPHPQPVGFNPHMIPFAQPQSANFGPLYSQDMPGPLIQEIPFGPQPFYIPPPIPMHGGLQEMPLQFGPQPSSMLQMQMESENLPIEPGHPPVDVRQSPNPNMQQDLTHQTNSLAASKEGDLRNELAKKRLAENQYKEIPDRIVFDMTLESRVNRNDNQDSEEWSRKVFVDDITRDKSREKSEDLREILRQKSFTKHKREISAERITNKRSPERNWPKQSQNRNSRWISPTRNLQRNLPERGGPRRSSPVRRDRRLSPRNTSLERHSSSERRREGRSIRSRESPLEDRNSRESLIDQRQNNHRSQYVRQRTISRSPRRSPFSGDEKRLRRISPTPHQRKLWHKITGRLANNIFMYKYVRQDSKTETDPIALLRSTRALDFDVDFDFVIEQVAIDEWQVSVILLTDVKKPNQRGVPAEEEEPRTLLVGEGRGATQMDARMRAAYHAVDTIQKACYVIEPNFGYFAEGGVPEFIARKHPIKTNEYEIIQNLDSGTPLSRYTIEVIFSVFLSSELEDLFFLASDFSYLERILVVEIANQMGLWWRLFGPRHPDTSDDDVVSTQHVCVYKEINAHALAHRLNENGGSTCKYTLVDPRATRIKNRTI